MEEVIESGIDAPPGGFPVVAWKKQIGVGVAD
jgi:hypothetical protein